MIYQPCGWCLAEELQAIAKQLSALDSEEAELHRKLALGTLSPEEMATVLDRLASIDTERNGLLGRQDMLEGATQLTEQLASLEDEREELLWVLATGELSPTQALSVRPCRVPFTFFVSVLQYEA